MSDEIVTEITSFNYEPNFIYNNNRNIKVLTTIEKELLCCEHFDISVAFITQGGIEPLLPALKILEEKNIKGRILTTDYLTFSDPKALKRLKQFNNIEIRMYIVHEDSGFHTKGYIFEKKEIYHIIVGSSNLTQTALTSNKEWNMKINAPKTNEVANDVLNEFNSMWSSSNTLRFDSFIKDYEGRYNQKKQIQAYIKSLSSNTQIELKPNSMQEAFIKNLDTIISEGKDRALLISATGTGKTYASAFAMKHFKFKRVLFLVHRNQLAVQAKKSYENVFGKSITTGLIEDGLFENEENFIFATINSIYKNENLSKFRDDDFDCIIVDEAHHSCAMMYQKIMNYFKPKLWLGMTATPDRVEGRNEENIIYKLFDYQIAYEIRLQQAMEQGLLCPFHYFGISDLQVINDEIVDEDNELSFNQLTSDERVKHIIKESNFYGYSGDRVKGLIFCNRINVAKTLSGKFNQLGYNTTVLDSTSTEQERQLAFDLLATNEDVLNGHKKLDYIFSVDLLNEGVDIVEVNQVIMLRRTTSPIIFIQQLGRGLRKHDDKEYVVVLDFIGNYKTNFIIPIALSGDKTYNKDNIRRFIAEGTNIISGPSTINFDEISKQKIYKALDNAEFNEASFIFEKYKSLKSKIGRIPTIKDFDDFGDLDVLHIIAKYGSYHTFLTKREPNYNVTFSNIAEEILKHISKRFMNGKRPNELEFLKLIIQNTNNNNLYSLYKNIMETKYHKNITPIQKQNIINVMSGNFEIGQDKKTYKNCIFIEQNDNDYICASTFKKLLENENFVNQIYEIIEFGLNRYQKEYANTYKDTDFVLNKKYTYYDVCHLLNWKENGVSQNIGGYQFDSTTNTYPVFINYQKDENISETTKYEDRFLSRDYLISLSKPGRKMDSRDIINFKNAKKNNTKVELFIRKNKQDKDEAKQFYFLGEIYLNGNPKESNLRKGVELPWKLDVPVREDIYDYIVNE